VNSIFLHAYFALKYESLLIYRKGFSWCYPFLFFMLVVLLFPLATSPQEKLLQEIGPGVIWVSALLAILLSLPGLFQQDFDDGSLEQFLLTPHPLSLLIFIKLLSKWILFGIPLLLIAPLLALLYHLSLHEILILEFTLLLGTPSLFYLGAIAAALTVGLKNSGFLLAITLFPLYVPILIFSVIAVLKAHMNLPFLGELAILGAFLAFVLPIAPMLAAFALRIGIVCEM
jgi:heme exporter protein B